MKLHAFYRVTRTLPAPLVPLFRDDSGTFYVQSIDENKRISGFILFEPEAKRVIVDRSIPYVEKNIGSPAVFSIEYEEKSIKYGDIIQTSANIKALHSDKYFQKHPFALLELASLAEIQDLIEEAIAECSKTLQKISPKLAASWILGSDIDSNLKSRFIDRIGSESDTNDVHLSFTSSYNALTALTEFSRSFERKYRAEIFRQAVSEIIDNGLDFIKQDEVNSFMQTFLMSTRSYTEDKNDFHREIVREIITNESRGNIKISSTQYLDFIERVSNVNAIDYIKIKVDDAERLLLYYFFFETRSRFLIFLMYMYYYTKFRDFKEFIDGLSLL